MSIKIFPTAKSAYAVVCGYGLLFIVAVFSGTAVIAGSLPSLCNAETIALLQQPYGLTQRSLLKHSASESSGDLADTLPAEKTRQYSYRISASYAHDKNAFTQGLVFHHGTLYESTGIAGQSSIRRVDPATGRILKQHKLTPDYFAEGLTVLNDQLLQLTWKSGVVFIYEIETLRPLAQRHIDGEGWGSTTIDGQLVISDGSSRLRVYAAGNDEVIRTIDVSEQQIAVNGLNELELVEGMIFANIWPTDCIAEIDPGSGEVVAWLDLSALLPKESRPEFDAVLNGIAYQPQLKRLLVTGKYWPYLYQIELIDSNAGSASVLHNDNDNE